MTQDEIKSHLDLFYNISSDRIAVSEVQAYYNIIAIKKQEPALANYHNSLYLDIKRFLLSYIETAEFLDYGYDEVNKEKVLKAISGIDIKAQMKLLRLTKRKVLMYSDNAEWVEDSIREKYIEEGGFLSKLKYLLITITSNVWYLVILVVVCFLILFTIMHEAPNTDKAWFIMKEYHFCDSENINILANECAWLLGIDGCQIEFYPKNIGGLLVFFFLFTILIVPLGKRLLDFVLNIFLSEK